MLPKDGSNRRSQAYAQTRLRLDSDQSVFRVYKGVKTFDFNREKNLIVTGGKDEGVGHGRGEGKVEGKGEGNGDEILIVRMGGRWPAHTLGK